MRFLKRLNMYRSASGKCSFDPNTMEAWSYSWWQFVAYIDGKVYFNGYHYSMPTGCQQRAVRSLLREHGIQYHYVSYRRGLQDINGQIQVFQAEIASLKAAIAKPRTHKQKNAERRESIAYLRQDIKLARRLARLKRRPFPVGTLTNFPPVPPKLTPEQSAERQKRRAAAKERRLQRTMVSQQQAEGCGGSGAYTRMAVQSIATRRSFDVIQGGAALSRTSKAMLTLVKGGS